MLNKINEIIIWFCDWKKCATIAQSKIAQSTILMPAFGYMILWSDYVDKHFKLIEPIQTQSLIHFDIKIMLLYWGSMSIAISTLVFLYYCPETIKISKDPIEYINKILSINYPSGLISALETIILFDKNENISRRLFDARKSVIDILLNPGSIISIKKDKSTSREKEIFEELKEKFESYNIEEQPWIRAYIDMEYRSNILYQAIDIIEDKTDILFSEHRQNVVKILDANHEIASSSNPKIASICLSLLLSGIILISIPSIDVLFSVGKITFGKLF